MQWFKSTGLRILVHLGALLPLLIIVRDYALDQLTANPIQEITLRTGKTTLILLVATLAVTPLDRLLGTRRLLPLRRTLGLYTFLYASLHLLTFIGLDYRFDFGLLWADIAAKRFIFAGLAAFLCLLALALTSNQHARKWLGKKWSRLQRLVYVAGIFAITHYLWQVKADWRQPLLFGVIVAVLLVVRLPPVRKALRDLPVRFRRH